MIKSFALALVALLPGEDASFNVRDYVAIASECADRYVGAQHVTLCDLSPAFKRIEDYVREHVPVGWQGYGTRSGGYISIPPGRWWISNPVRFCRQWTVEGAGGGDWGAPTVIYTPHGVSGMRLAAYDECSAEGVGQGSNGTTLGRFALLEVTHGTKTSTSVAAVPYGILMEARGEIRDVWVRGYVQGVRVSADVNRRPITNANRWRLSNVIVSSTEHAGIYVDGGDTNAGLALSPDVTAGCVRGSAWAARLGPCANILPSEFIGSTWVAASASGSSDTETGENFPNYLFEGAGQKDTCIGCYSESDAVRPQLAQHTTWIGLTAMDGVGGYRQAGMIASGLQLVNDRDPSNKVTTYLGAASTTGGAGLELVPSGGALFYPLRLKAEPAQKAWRLDVANLNSGIAMRIGGTADASGGYGGVTIPRPLALGSPSIAVQVVSSTTALGLPCEVGTESLLRSPKSGRDTRAICVTGGTWEARP